MIFWVSFSSRKEKREVLLQIIYTLPVSNEEKELYIFSMDILDDSEFFQFFEKITQDITLHAQMNFSFTPITS